MSWSPRLLPYDCTHRTVSFGARELSRVKSFRSRCFCLVLALMLAISCATERLAAPIGPLDWDALAEEWFAIVLTTDPDGSQRETRVVFVVMEDTGIVRTGSTLWFANIQRDPDIRLRIGGKVYLVRAEPIDDEEALRAINDEFRTKYGFGDWLVDWFRPRDRNVLRMRERRSASNVLEGAD